MFYIKNIVNMRNELNNEEMVIKFQIMKLAKLLKSLEWCRGVYELI
jgi:hypothetical protein